MKYSILLLLTVFSICSLKAQEVLSSKDSLFIEGPNAPNEGGESDIYDEFVFKNVNAASDSFRWVRVVNNLPSNKWTSAVCDIYLCHGVTVDSSDFVMETGDSGTFYSHFYPGTGNGSAEMVIEIYNITDPSQRVRVYSRATAWDLFNSTKNIVSFQDLIYPNPIADGFIQLKENIQSLSIKDINGKEVFSHQSTMYQNKIDVSDLVKGVYFAELKDMSNHIHFQKIIIE